MADKWIKIAAGAAEGRNYSIEQHEDDRSYRVNTTQKAAVGPEAIRDEDAVLITGTIDKGAPIQIEGEDKVQLEANLVTDGDFSAVAAAQIAGRIP